VTFSVIVPAYQAATYLAPCLDALAASTLAPLEILVVDDGSSDASATIAAGFGAIVLCVPGGPRGPAWARNLGAARARGDVLCFLDADVVIHPDALAKMAECLSEASDVAAVFGSYDDAPEATSTVSRYRNLFHHFVHQESDREAVTFWAGCGAIRRSVFEAIGGFDERYVHPSIEDIELGGRLRDAGHRVWLRRDIQATHLKRWTLGSMIRTDIADRAIPWTRLIVARARLPRDLNTSVRSRLSAVSAWVAVLGCLSAVFLPHALWVAGAAVVAGVALNARLYGFFLRRGGVAFAIVSAAMHTMYLLYSSLTFVVVAASLRCGVGERPRA
jgi:GT2 family glycosyltransferase